MGGCSRDAHASMYCKFAAVYTCVILLQITLILHLRLSVILALLLSSDLARTTRLCTFREHVLMKVRPCYCQTVCGPFTSGVKGGGTDCTDDLSSRV